MFFCLYYVMRVHLSRSGMQGGARAAQVPGLRRGDGRDIF